jgi:hypothetical protein
MHQYENSDLNAHATAYLAWLREQLLADLLSKNIYILHHVLQLDVTNTKMTQYHQTYCQIHKRDMVI